MTTWLHEERLCAVQKAIAIAKPSSVLDLGCGEGEMFLRLAHDPTLDRLVGLDICAPSLARLRAKLGAAVPCVPDIRVLDASMLAPPAHLAGFDCALLIETIEHLRPAHLSQLENALFRTLRPTTIIVTTPNAEFNPLLGVPPTRFRHPGHHFEWTRAKFRHWASRAAGQAGYAVRFDDIGGLHPDFGGASQMAVFDVAG